MYETLRDDDPAHHVEDGDYWVLSRYSDVQAAVLDTGRYSSASGLTVGYDELAAAGLEKAVPLVMLDPPEHTEFRESIGHSYTPRRVAGIEPTLRRFVRARLDAIAELGKCDIVAELFRPVPSFVVAGYLGVPEADQARFDGWTQGIVQATAGDPPAAATAAGLFGYFADLIEHRRAEPADDAISDLVHLMDGDPAGTLRILGFAFTMIAGGNDTATGLLGGAAELLTVNPGQRQLLLDRPDLLPGAIEELLRLTSPVQCLARTLTRSTTVHERVIPGAARSCCCTDQPTGTHVCSAPALLTLTSCAADRSGRGTWRSPSARTTAWALPPPGCRPHRTHRTARPLPPLRRRPGGRHLCRRALHPPLRHPPLHHRRVTEILLAPYGFGSA